MKNCILNREFFPHSPTHSQTINSLCMFLYNLGTYTHPFHYFTVIYAYSSANILYNIINIYVHTYKYDKYYRLGICLN